MDGSMEKPMGIWMATCTSVERHGILERWMDNYVQGQTDRWFDEWTAGGTHGYLEVHMDTSLDRWISRGTGGHLLVQIDGHQLEQMDTGVIDGHLEGLMGIRSDIWTRCMTGTPGELYRWTRGVTD
ncbi:hypothetical protein llap_10644 [Limosa lapponica baueri]|uniref:Uncharacterized protein n=1 Tax=Limosa lapponica baueri TaxID=1758121 RepID=A0A2I0TZ12_LIMLA|nr:hypothetical protein llap_10644 [Limosa lapponica baueri]